MYGAVDVGCCWCGVLSMRGVDVWCCRCVGVAVWCSFLSLRGVAGSMGGMPGMPDMTTLLQDPELLTALQVRCPSTIDVCAIRDSQ